jgi:uncharacterized membrane protein
LATELWAIGLVIFAAFLGAFGGLFLKLGADKLKFSIKALMRNWRLMLGVFFYGISTVFFILGLRGGDLSVLYPFGSLTYVCVVLFSIKLLNEKMNIYKWIGICSVMLGVILVGLSG